MLRWQYMLTQLLLKLHLYKNAFSNSYQKAASDSAVQMIELADCSMTVKW